GTGYARGLHGYSSTPRGYSQPQFPHYDNQQFQCSGYQQMVLAIIGAAGRRLGWPPIVMMLDS
ncbi:hypothetical protein, partial [Neptuniibacter sp.]|uniref:hypothetical protein n=1 Tax=Neptuniibacter sp. TaxID=1962643 RepID=UPI002635D98F